MRKFPRVISSAEGLGRGPRLAPGSRQANGSCPLQGVLAATTQHSPSPQGQGADVTTLRTPALVKSRLGEDADGGVFQGAAFPQTPHR